MSRALFLLAVFAACAAAQSDDPLHGLSADAAESTARELASRGDEGRVRLEAYLQANRDLRQSSHLFPDSRDEEQMIASRREWRGLLERGGVLAVLALARIGSVDSVRPLRRLSEIDRSSVGRAATFAVDWLEWRPAAASGPEDRVVVAEALEAARLRHGRGSARFEFWPRGEPGIVRSLEYDVDDLLSEDRTRLRERRFRRYTVDDVPTPRAASWTGESWDLSVGLAGPRFAGREPLYDGPCVGALDLGGLGHLLVPPGEYSIGVPRDLEGHLVRLLLRLDGLHPVRTERPGWIVFLGRDEAGRPRFRWAAVLRCDSPLGWHTYWTRGEVRLDPATGRAALHEHSGLWTAGARGDGERYVEARHVDVPEGR